jgi:phosphotriesterase-related protein
LIRPPRTVDGRSLQSAYQLVLAHEHVFIDTRCWVDESHEPTRHLRHERVDDAVAVALRENPFACLDNLVLDDAEAMAAELALLPDPGHTLIIDVTPSNIGRDPDRVARVADRVGVDLVFGCGRYIAESRPRDDPSLPAEAYRDEILEDFSTSSPRPAVIGEIGTGAPIQPCEASSLRGAAMAQAELGVPLYVHLHPWARHGHEALDIVDAAGGDLSRTVLCHLDPQIPAGLDYHRALCDRGATIAFDIWGDEFGYGALAMPTDEDRLRATIALMEAGYGHRIVHSQDVCTKLHLHRFGGPGFAHLPNVVAPMMQAAGMTVDEMARQLSGNALALFAAT